MSSCDGDRPNLIAMTTTTGTGTSAGKVTATGTVSDVDTETSKGTLGLTVDDSILDDLTYIDG